MMSKNIVSLRQMKEFKNEKGNLIDISTVGKFETEKYLGEWYEIARYDHRFEKNLKDVMATYILQKNGMIKVVNKGLDRKSTRLNSSHQIISYAVFCLKKKKHNI